LPLTTALNGPLPSSFRALKKLRILNLEQNGISGTLPPSLCEDLPELEVSQLVCQFQLVVLLSANGKVNLGLANYFTCAELYARQQKLYALEHDSWPI